MSGAVCAGRRSMGRSCSHRWLPMLMAGSVRNCAQVHRLWLTTWGPLQSLSTHGVATWPTSCPDAGLIAPSLPSQVTTVHLFPVVALSTAIAHLSACLCCDVHGIHSLILLIRLPAEPRLQDNLSAVLSKHCGTWNSPTAATAVTYSRLMKSLIPATCTYCYTDLTCPVHVHQSTLAKEQSLAYHEGRPWHCCCELSGHFGQGIAS